MNRKLLERWQFIDINNISEINLVVPQIVKNMWQGSLLNINIRIDIIEDGGFKDSRSLTRILQAHHDCDSSELSDE
jgi:hypothetical protein